MAEILHVFLGVIGSEDESSGRAEQREMNGLDRVGGYYEEL